MVHAAKMLNSSKQYQLLCYFAKFRFMLKIYILCASVAHSDVNNSGFPKRCYF